MSNFTINDIPLDLKSAMNERFGFDWAQDKAWMSNMLIMVARDVYKPNVSKPVITPCDSNGRPIPINSSNKVPEGMRDDYPLGYMDSVKEAWQLATAVLELDATFGKDESPIPYSVTSMAEAIRSKYKRQA